VRPFLSPPVFSADVLRNDGYMFRLCRRLALGLLQIGWLLTSRGSANLFADIEVGRTYSFTSEAVSEAHQAEEFPGSRGRRSRKVDDFPLICREEGLGRLPFEFACFWIKIPANLSRSDDADRAGVLHESAVFVTDRPAAPRSSNSDDGETDAIHRRQPRDRGIVPINTRVDRNTINGIGGQLRNSNGRAGACCSFASPR
jgi:hypothetical protein